MRANGPAELLSRLALLWAGLAIGVAFVATPAKFLAPSLSLPVALDVGRQTFAVCNRVELLLLAGMTVLALFSPSRRAWLARLAAPAAIVLAQALWLIPVLDGRVAEILAGRTPPPSNLHAIYIAAEAVKIASLVTAAVLRPGRGRRSAGLAGGFARRSAGL